MPMPTDFIFILCALVNAGPQSSVDYQKDIKPILRERCYACHGALKQESGLRLDTVALMKKGGTNGPVVFPKDINKSNLFHKVNEKDTSLRMPPEGKALDSDQIEKMKAWIIQGAKSSPDEVPEKDPRMHWAFLKPTK